MLNETQHVFGDVQMQVYDFSKGDMLPMHSHDAETVHVTVICRGSFRAAGDGWEKTVAEGQIVNWEIGQRHELEALVDNARLINIPKTARKL